MSFYLYFWCFEACAGMQKVLTVLRTFLDGAAKLLDFKVGFLVLLGTAALLP